MRYVKTMKDILTWMWADHTVGNIGKLEFMEFTNIRSKIKAHFVDDQLQQDYDEA